MKKIVFVLAMMMAVSYAMAQEPLSYSEVIQQEGKSSSEIYKSVKKWFAKTFRSAQDVIQYDGAGEEVSGKAVIVYEEKSMTWAAASGLIYYNIEVKVKDGRFKVVIDNFIHKSTHPTWGEKWSNGLVYGNELTDDQLKAIGHGGLAKKQYRAIDKRVKPLCFNEIASLVASLKTFMSEEQKENDDW